MVGTALAVDALPDVAASDLFDDRDLREAAEALWRRETDGDAGTSASQTKPTTRPGTRHCNYLPLAISAKAHGPALMKNFEPRPAFVFFGRADL